MTIQEMLKDVIGYKPHLNKIDIQVVAEHSICDNGHQMTYRGFKKNNTYRAFAICEICDAAEEF